RPHKEPNGSRLPRSSFDEAVSLQGLDHLVNRGRRNLEIFLQIRFRRSLAMNLGVMINKRQVLPLLRRERGCTGWIASRCGAYSYFKSVLAKAVEDTDLNDRKLSTEHRPDGFFSGGV